MAVDKLVDSTQLDADLTSVANAIRTKGGTSADLAFPAGFVSAVEAIPTGGGGGLAKMAHPLGHSIIRDSVPSGTQRGVAEIVRGANTTHIKMSFTSSFTGSNVCFINLTNGQSGANGTVVNSQPLWFTIPAGKPCVFKMMNVVNNSNVLFATNFRLTSSTSSPSFGSGNATHLSGETINATLASEENVGCLFINFDNSTAKNLSGKSVEFDVSFTVDGVQYF